MRDAATIGQNGVMTRSHLGGDAGRGSRWFRAFLFAWALGLGALTAGAAEPAPDDNPLIALGPGDGVSIRVYGQPDMDGVGFVAADGTLKVPLAGAVPVGGLTATEAAKRVEQALVAGQYLKNPQVTLNVTQSRRQRVSVLGEVHSPGRYPADVNTSVIDLLAQAGGLTDNAGDLVVVLHPETDGSVSRRTINLHDLVQASTGGSERIVLSGESVFVPRAEQFYVYGAVTTPGAFRLEQNMTVRQAIARAGGVNSRGSDRRVDIQRRGKNGEEITVSAKASDLVQANDVIKVKESLF